MTRARTAIEHPDDAISIAIDGTDQMGWGYPKGPEGTHAEANNRLKRKIMIAMVHGCAVYFYLMPDDVANGPDESIETLQRTLQHEERRRGGKLPETSYNSTIAFARVKIHTCWPIYRGWLNAGYLSAFTCPIVTPIMNVTRLQVGLQSRLLALT